MRLRVGAPTDDDIDLLNLTWGAGGDDAWPDHQRLRWKNCEVDGVNDQRLSQQAGEWVSFKCVDTINVEHANRQATVYTKLQQLARGVIQKQQTRWAWRQVGSAWGKRAGGRQGGRRLTRNASRCSFAGTTVTSKNALMMYQLMRLSSS